MVWREHTIVCCRQTMDDSTHRQCTPRLLTRFYASFSFFFDRPYKHERHTDSSMKIAQNNNRDKHQKQPGERHFFDLKRAKRKSKAEILAYLAGFM